MKSNSVQHRISVPREVSDEVDQMIIDKKMNALENLILSGDYWRLEDRVYPLGCQDVQLLLDQLLVTLLGKFIGYKSIKKRS